MLKQIEGSRGGRGRGDVPPAGDLRVPDHPADPHRRGTVRDGEEGRAGRRVPHPGPLPARLGSSPADTVKVARLATESGLFSVFEAEAGEVTSSTPIRCQVPVTDYLRIQARYAHLFKPEEKTEVIGRIQATADRNIRRFGLASLDAERAEVALSGKE